MHSKLLASLLLSLARRVMSRPPDQTIGPTSDPYMLRWRLLPKGWWPNIYFHEFWRSDSAEALHDHPTDNVSIILEGSYYEIFEQLFIESHGNGLHLIIRPGRQEVRLVGDIIPRRAETPHRIALFDGPWGQQRVLTAFICGPRRRVWGWHCPKGWISWTQFDKQKGCGE